MLTKMEEKLTKAVLVRLDDEGVQQWRKHLAHLDVRTRETFDQMVQHLKEKGMPAEILQRHQTLITAYDTEMATLQNRRGNACDTASLLIARLRAAKIPARYAIGTVQIPIDKVMNWVGGVLHPEAALQMLGQGGIPNTALVQSGVITAVRLEHIWVEAWVDFVPSRGAVHREGDTWVPLDASFKQYQSGDGRARAGSLR